MLLATIVQAVGLQAFIFRQIQTALCATHHQLRLLLWLFGSSRFPAGIAQKEVIHEKSQYAEKNKLSHDLLMNSIC